MITWMQRHRKYLVITIWISTIAFIGAGFVGWGQYRYGDKSGAVAKVGDVSITGQELQKAYAQLFNQYSQMFEGRFDQEQAKQFGLDKQALRQLINEALLVNLANSYNLEATDGEVAETLQAQQAFTEHGAFSKSLYLKVLKQNRLTPAEYEGEVRKSILIQKLLALFPSKANGIEKEAFETVYGLADKVEYKILTPDRVAVDTSDDALKAYWETHKNDYMTPRAFKIAYIEQPLVSSEADDETMHAYYDAHKYDFTGPDGKLLGFDDAKSAVRAALDDKATNKAALKTYIAYKKEKLEADVAISEKTVSENSADFSAETLKAIASATAENPYLKPKKEGDRYVIIKVAATIDPAVKSFADAKTDVLADYSRQARLEKLMETAKAEAATFSGTVTEGYLKRSDATGVKGLDEAETNEFFGTLFAAEKAQGTAQLQTGKIVLFRILDQKIEKTDTPEVEQTIAQAKSALFSRGLITALENRYETKIFVKGLGQ